MAQQENSMLSSPSTQAHQTSSQPKKKRNQPGMPDPEAEVVALSPNTLLATNRFVCEICGKGFQRDQNLQLHRRGHNLPWKLRHRGEPIKKRVYVCPVQGCVHHDPLRALGDLTGIKKHFCRKHGEKKWKCERCSKKYAVQSDCKAHLKICGTREYKCDCGTIFSRRDSFVTHRAFCDALTQESAKVQSLSDGSKAMPMETTTSSAVESPVVSFNQSSEVQDTAARVTKSVNSASCSTSNHKDSDDAEDIIDDGNGNGNGNGNSNVGFDSSVFAPVSGFSPSLMSQNLTSYPGLLTTMPNIGHLSTYPIIPPPLPSLSPLYNFPTTAGPNASLQDHESFSSTLLQPSLSATALLQKAAEMGAVTSRSSRMIQSQDQQVGDNSVKIEDDGDMTSAHRLDTPSQNLTESGQMMAEPSAYFGSKPMTLDLLGLGNLSATSFPVHNYINGLSNSIGIDVEAFREGTESLLKVSSPEND